jgi:hypothetical protein
MSIQYEINTGRKKGDCRFESNLPLQKWVEGDRPVNNKCYITRCIQAILLQGSPYGKFGKSIL